MCCFTGSVHVEGTRIFARHDAGRRTQVIVYEMAISAENECAMVLPVPIDRDLRELKFINLDGYSELFADLDRCFPRPVSRSVSTVALGGPGEPLRVERVGSYDASFVPTVADFSRLDRRFRMADDVWQRLTEVADYAFAVFKLRSGHGQRLHPMAFRFATREPRRLYFPTLHVHDGAVHSEANFDHALYAQREEGAVMTPPDTYAAWARATVMPRDVMKLSGVVRGDLSRGVVVPELLPWKRTMSGTLPNQDTWFAVAG